MKETLNKAGLRAPKTGDTVVEEESTDKQDKKPTLDVKSNRNSDGTFKKGAPSPNPMGRPKLNESVVERFRNNEKVVSVIEKLFKVADTLGTDSPDKDALSASKLIIERIIPSLKASEMRIDTDNDTGFVLLPTPEPPEKEDD